MIFILLSYIHHHNLTVSFFKKLFIYLAVLGLSYGLGVFIMSWRSFAGYTDSLDCAQAQLGHAALVTLRHMGS